MSFVIQASPNIFHIDPTRLPENKDHVFLSYQGTYDQRTIMLIFQRIFFHPWSPNGEEFQIEEFAVQQVTFTHYSFPKGLQQQIDRIARWVGKRAECGGGIGFYTGAFHLLTSPSLALPNIIRILKDRVGLYTVDVYTVSSPPPHTSLLNFLNLLEAYGFSSESCMSLLAHHIQGKRPFPELTSPFVEPPKYSVVEWIKRQLST